MNTFNGNFSKTSRTNTTDKTNKTKSTNSLRIENINNAIYNNNAPNTERSGGTIKLSSYFNENNSPSKTQTGFLSKHRQKSSLNITYSDEDVSNNSKITYFKDDKFDPETTKNTHWFGNAYLSNHKIPVVWFDSSMVKRTALAKKYIKEKNKSNYKTHFKGVQEYTQNYKDCNKYNIKLSI